MADNLPAVIAFSFALSGPLLVWSATLPRSDSWRGNVGLCAEVFAIVAAAVVTRYGAVPALQWLAVRPPQRMTEPLRFRGNMIDFGDIRLGEPSPTGIVLEAVGWPGSVAAACPATGGERRAGLIPLSDR